MTFREIIEGKDITKEAIKRIKKNGEVMLVNDKGILVSFTDFDDGYFVGMDQFDNDVETDSLKYYSLDESNIKSDEKIFIKKNPNATITYKNNKSGDKIVYVNGQTAFNMEDKGIGSSEKIQFALNRAYKASLK